VYGDIHAYCPWGIKFDEGMLRYAHLPVIRVWTGRSPERKETPSGGAPIRHVCSLGSLCQSSMMLVDTGLKRESYPFDWIFSNPTTIERILDDDFGRFLQRDLLVGNGADQCSHLVYGERMLHHHKRMFYHHNPRDNDEHYMYFTRCVRRFRALLSSDASKLFVVTFPNLESGAIAGLKTEVAQLNARLSTMTRNYQLFVILHVPHCDVFDASIVDASNVRFVTLSTKSESGGLLFTDPNENRMLHKILRDSYDFAVEKLES
jgi:hypothetical protein